MSYTMPPAFADPNKMVKMFGPSLSDPSKMVNREVPLRDVIAFERAGYKKGSIPEETRPEAMETPVIEQIEAPEPPKDTPPVKSAKKAKK